MKTSSILNAVAIGIFLFLLSMGPLLKAQPPAQGPPATDANGEALGISLISGIIKAQLDNLIQITNTDIQNNSGQTKVKATLSYTMKMYKPAMSSTQVMDSPNEQVVRIPYSIEYTIKDIKYKGIPYFSRKLHQSITVFVSCNQWFSNNGNLKARFNADRPVLDEASFAEEALNFFIGNTLLDFVDNKIKTLLPPPMTQVFDAPTFRCNCLGVNSGTSPKYEDSEILYQLQNIPPELTTNNLITIKLDNIRRLAAKDDNNKTLYAESEDLQLVFYANNKEQVFQLQNMKEGDVHAFEAETMIASKKRSKDRLVLIGRLDYTSLGQFVTESNFKVFQKSANFGNGKQKLIIKKTYFSKPFKLPNGNMSKPKELKRDAYELNFTITSIIPVVLGKRN